MRRAVLALLVVLLVAGAVGLGVYYAGAQGRQESAPCQDARARRRQAEDTLARSAAPAGRELSGEQRRAYVAAGQELARAVADVKRACSG